VVAPLHIPPTSVHCLKQNHICLPRSDHTPMIYLGAQAAIAHGSNPVSRRVSRSLNPQQDEVAASRAAASLPYEKLQDER
jgi:hypothetical protein